MEIVLANGVEQCTDTFGNPADPALVLLHGAGDCLLAWDEALCARLAAGGRFVIRRDARDAGGSATYPRGAPPYGLRDLVEDAAALAERAHFVGMSQGASIAQLLALEHPERVAAITLIASTPGNPASESRGLPAPSVASGEPPEPDWADREAVVEYIVEAHRPYAPRFEAEAMRALAGRAFGHSRDIAASQTNPYLIDGPRWRERLGEIAAPALVIHGAQDPMFPPAHARALAAEIPGARHLVLDGMGHECPPPHTWDAAVPAILQL